MRMQGKPVQEAVETSSRQRRLLALRGELRDGLELIAEPLRLGQSLAQLLLIHVKCALCYAGAIKPDLPEPALHRQALARLTAAVLEVAGIGLAEAKRTCFTLPRSISNNELASNG